MKALEQATAELDKKGEKFVKIKRINITFKAENSIGTLSRIV